jgi:hypothetical protein
LGMATCLDRSSSVGSLVVGLSFACILISCVYRRVLVLLTRPRTRHLTASPPSSVIMPTFGISWTPFAIVDGERSMPRVRRATSRR